MVQAPTTQEPSQQSEQQEILPPEEEQKLRDKWEQHFDLFYKENITQRKYQIRVDRHIDSKLLATVDKIVNEKLKVMYESEGVSLWDLNVIYYRSAVAILEAKGKLREIKNMTNNRINPDGEYNWSSASIPSGEDYHLLISTLSIKGKLNIN